MFGRQWRSEVSRTLGEMTTFFFSAFALGAVIEAGLLAAWWPGVFRTGLRLWRFHVKREPREERPPVELDLSGSANRSRAWRPVLFERLSGTEVAFRESLGPSLRLGVGLSGVVKHDDSRGVTTVCNRIGWATVGFVISSLMVTAQMGWPRILITLTLVAAVVVGQYWRLRAVLAGLRDGGRLP